MTPEEEEKTNPDLTLNGEWPRIVSRFQLVILAGLRSKQLLRGAQPRIVVDPLKRRNTSIALEELRRGLIPFNALNHDESRSLNQKSPQDLLRVSPQAVSLT